MLTFNIVLGLLGPPIPRVLVILFSRFFFSIRPTDSISGNAFDAKRNLEFAQQRNCHWLRVDGTKSWTGRFIKSGQFGLLWADHFWPLEGEGVWVIWLRVRIFGYLWETVNRFWNSMHVVIRKLLHFALLHYALEKLLQFALKDYYILHWKFYYILRQCYYILWRFLLHFALILHSAA